MLNGETLTVLMNNTFQHKFENMTISINQRVIKVSMSKNKVLKDGKYLPIYVNENFLLNLYYKITQISKYLNSYLRNIKFIKKYLQKTHHKDTP
jgi:hypothetical protein